jgi:ferric-dicitrate binding protein FerR (iron transport regulator)
MKNEKLLELIGQIERKSEKLLHMVGLIDDRLIAEADTLTISLKPAFPVWARWTSLAAGLAAAAIAVVALLPSDAPQAPVVTEPEWTAEVSEVVTEEADTGTLAELTGTVNIERGDETLAARAGMTLQNLDTLRTEGESTARLQLEEDRAVELGELSTLHIDKQDKGFVLTLAEGAVTAWIDRPLDTGEEFTVMAGGLAMSARGTAFWVNHSDGRVFISVWDGTVAVLDEDGEVLDELSAGESGFYRDGVRLPYFFARFSVTHFDYGDHEEFAGVSMMIGILDGSWDPSFVPDQADITGLVLYVDGTPYPIDPDTCNIFINGPEYTIHVGEQHYSLVEVYPARYDFTFEWQGIEFEEKDYFGGGITIDAEGTAHWD